MKKYLVGFLATAFILTACTGIKSPKFNRYSNEVTYEEYDAAMDGKQIFPEGTNSMVISTYAGLQRRETTSIGEKRLVHTDATMNSNFSYRYDNERKVATVSGKTETIGTQSGVNTSYQFADSNKVEEQLQLETVGDKNYVTKINKEMKTFQYVKEATDDDSITDALFDAESNYAVMGILLFAFVPANYPYASEEEKAGYKFYVDDERIFTASVKTSKTNETKTGTGDDEHVQYTKVSEADFLGQIVISKDSKSIDFYVKYTDKKTTTYAENCSVYDDGEYKNHYQDEIDYEETIMSITFSIKLKDVSLKRIDLSSYTEVLA